MLATISIEKWKINVSFVCCGLREIAKFPISMSFQHSNVFCPKMRGRENEKRNKKITNKQTNRMHKSEYWRCGKVQNKKKMNENDQRKWTLKTIDMFTNSSVYRVKMNENVEQLNKYLTNVIFRWMNVR